MTKRKKTGVYYIAAAIFLFAAGYFTYNSGDIVFVVITVLTGIILLIAGVMQFKYAKEAAIKAQQNKKHTKKASGPKRK